MIEVTLKHAISAWSPSFLKAWGQRIASSGIGYRLAHGAAWSLAGALISRGLGLCSSIFVARLLGNVGFGELGIIQSTLGMFATFAGFGLGLTVTKHVAEFRINNPVRAGRIIGLSSIVAWITGGMMALLLYLLAPWLAVRSLGAAHLTGLLRLGSLMLLLGGINGAQTGALAGFEAFKSIAQINFLAGMATFPLMVGGAWCWGLQGALLGLLTSQAINCGLNFLGVRALARRAGIPLAFNGVFKESRIIWSFSVPALLSGVMVGPVNWCCSALIVNQPGGYSEMGIFNAANQWRLAILFFPSMLASVSLPILSSLWGASSISGFRKVLKANLGISLISTILIAFPVALAAHLIMSCYGDAFAFGSRVLAVLCVVATVEATLNVVGQNIAVEGRMWVGFLLNTIWAGVLLFTSFQFRSRGAFGLAQAYLVAYCVHFVTVSTYVYWRLKTTLPNKL
jgi:O-antigen/teichoic acid export membrane protein